MKSISPVKRITICAMCIALCYVLPVAFHAIGLGGALSPMHIPVLLCGLVCGGGYGALCGLLGPVLSSVLSGMPPLPMLVRMIPELVAYGLTCGVCMRFFRFGHLMADTYASLGVAMVAGRIIGGIASAIFFAVTSGVYSIAMWATGYFAESLPGIAAHLIFVPVLVLTLEKARLLPVRYQTINQE